MGSIPLAANNLRPLPAPPDLLGEYGKLQALKQQQAMAPLQQQMAQQQVQEGQLGIQQKQIALQNQQALTQAYQKWDGNNYADLPHLALQAGASGDAVMALQQHALTIKKTISDIASTDATTGSKNLDMFEKQNNQVAGALQSVLSVPDEQMPQKLNDTVQQLSQMKKYDGTPMLDPQHIQLAQQLIQQGPQAIKTALPIFQKDFMALDEQTKQAKAQLDLQTEQTKNDWYKQHGGAPGVPVEAVQQADWLQKHPGQGPSDYAVAMKKIVPAYNFNLQQSAGAGSNPLNEGQKATVTAILEGRMTPPSSFALKTPYWQNIMGNVFEQDPQFSEQRAQLRKDFTTGKHSTEINSINTALGHVGVLGDAVDALNNGNVQVLNRIANNLGAQVGATPQTTFNTIVHRVGPEITKAYVGAGGGEGERGTTEKDFDPALGPQQLKSNVGVTAKLLRSKISSLENQWNQNKSDNMPSFQDRFIMPQAQQQLKKWAPEGGNTSGQNSPVEGTIKTNSAGDKVKFHNGAWGPA